MWNLTLMITQEWECIHAKNCLEKLVFFVFCCEGTNLLTLFW